MKYFNIILISIAITSLGSCVKKRELSQNTIIAHIASSPNGLHPFNDNSGNRSYVFNYTQKTLIKSDLRTLEIIPILIKNLPIPSEDGLAYTYELIEGVKWSDGTPLTVDDVIFTSKIQIAPLTNNSQIKGIYSSVIKNIHKDTKNPNKFIVECKMLHISNAAVYEEIYIQQKSYWDPDGVLDNFTFKNIHDISYQPTEKITNWFNDFNDGNNSYVPEKLVGLGPYQVTEFISGSYISIEKKENWYGDNSDFLYDQNYPDKIIFKIIQDEAATYLAIKNQQIDVSTRLGTSKLIKLQELDYFNENYNSAFLPEYTYDYIGLNTKPDGIEYKSFFTDKNVRRAMAHLTPVDEIIDVIEQNHANRQIAQISPLKKWYNDKLPPITFNLKKAKELLDAAGWKDTDGNNIRDKVINGEKVQFSFKLSYMSGKASTREKALMIKEAMYLAGIEAVPTPMDFTIFYKNASNHKFDAMMGAWGGGAGYQDPMQLWHTESWANKGSNFTGFGDAESDSLIYLANTSLDKQKHYAAIKALQKKVYDEQPFIVLYSRQRKVLIHKRFDKAKMYNDKPGVILNNFILEPKFSGSTLKPE